MYPVDWLVFGRSHVETRYQCQLGGETLQSLGFLFTRSPVLTTTHTLMYLGAFSLPGLGPGYPLFREGAVLVDRAIVPLKGDSAPASSWTSQDSLGSHGDYVRPCRPMLSVSYENATIAPRKLLPSKCAPRLPLGSIDGPYAGGTGLVGLHTQSDDRDATPCTVH